ncbi:tetratricopeptide repeat protein [Nitrospirillum sp. BR 11164]|uniref:tetratricopeptide repeat protein n=1 Tax=Nitrospirillum sp. BR 11164 TaxID=3104324 RepID=UPI002AFF04C1|nr:tetratricopeptide repeat protein [Nitrospirillum sp. BR 11164]MEA1650254.1 tetratricopeptide repeat protein [Nitrospirillum sp. BR 11164]
MAPCTSWAASDTPTARQVKAAVDAGDLPKAEGLLRDVIRHRGDSARAHYQLGQVLGLEGRHLEAVEELTLSRKIDPALHFAKPAAFQKRLDHELALVPPPPAPVPPPASVATEVAAVSPPPPAVYTTQSQIDPDLIQIFVVVVLLILTSILFVVVVMKEGVRGGRRVSRVVIVGQTSFTATAGSDAAPALGFDPGSGGSGGGGSGGSDWGGSNDGGAASTSFDSGRSSSGDSSTW